MIGEALQFLNDQLNTYLGRGENGEERVRFINGESTESLTFHVGAISTLLINLEEEHSVRQPDNYSRTSVNGFQERVQPPIRLSLYVLFVACYSHYKDSLHTLSRIIRFFQSHRVFNHQNAPALSPEIDRLVLELTTLPFAEQNEVWNALRTTYHPSILYKVKMIVFQEEDAIESPLLQEIMIETSQ